MALISPALDVQMMRSRNHNNTGDNSTYIEAKNKKLQQIETVLIQWRK